MAWSTWACLQRGVVQVLHHAVFVEDVGDATIHQPQHALGHAELLAHRAADVGQEAIGQLVLVGEALV